MALGELLSSADATCRPILSAYSASSNHAKNVSTISSSKFSADSLEQCANFLGLKTRDGDNGKIYSNKPTLADRIILKIESYFETDCLDCSQKYRIKLGETPRLTCFLCFQGSHDCEKFTTYTAPNPTPVGNIWICSGCYKKNDLVAPSKTRKQSNSEHSVTFDVGNSAKDKETEEEAVSDGEELSNKELDNRSENPICKLYLKNACPHGITGKKEINHRTCDEHHPKRCFRFVKEGPTSKRGCNKGKKCEYFHPTLCKYSVKNRRCTNKECSFVHIRGTKRWPKNEDRPRRTDESHDIDHHNRPYGRRTAPRSRSNSVSEDTTRQSSRNRALNLNSTQISWKDPCNREKNDNNPNVVKLIQDLRGDFQRELEQMRSQIYFLKQPAPPPWMNLSQSLQPLDQSMIQQNMGPAHIENQTMMHVPQHQIPQHQLPLYRDTLLRQHYTS